MKQVIAKYLSKKDARSSSALLALTVGSMNAGSPWNG